MVTAPEDLLWARGLHYEHEGSPALLDVSVGVREGEIVSVTGPRGSGKSTLLGCLSGRLVPGRGEVWFDGVPVHGLTASARERLRRGRFGWVGSEPHLLPELTVWENAALPLLLSGTGRREARRRAGEWLDRLDVGEFARSRPGALLHAQRQRVAIARALAHSPTVVFADEPTARLHQGERTRVLRTLTTAARSHRITVVLASHDARVAGVADRSVMLVDGRRVGAEAPSDAPATAGRTAGKPGSEGRAPCSLST
ncbi:ATP-binding cassette domain-containing protein [Streptomyces sp. TRM43335]|uniref:ATP-binding cassette domain-containing protein n=1 Tax=Streptomyces taklimakanensis TaxID=2569853 RepID=A0A6G2BGN2_9ACTN|nr:ATP-binding cassette domain-containing protein [Streptomyces taklimakanensis]MTE21229.1 ATP-binding cassette domain-containing protein [Streptomyces taklimakanensis]